MLWAIWVPNWPYATLCLQLLQLANQNYINQKYFIQILPRKKQNKALRKYYIFKDINTSEPAVNHEMEYIRKDEWEKKNTYTYIQTYIHIYIYVCIYTHKLLKATTTCNTLPAIIRRSPLLTQDIQNNWK